MMKKLNAQELTLHIAVNLGRLGRFALEGKEARLKQFLDETDEFRKQLQEEPKAPNFQKTFDFFNETFIRLKSDVRLDSDWAEESFTWANILTHRAKLA